MKFELVSLLALSCVVVLTGAPAKASAKPEAKLSSWDRVWKVLQAGDFEPVPAAAAQDGPPVREGNRVLFRFRASAGATKVYLAGSFNDWGAQSRWQNHRSALCYASFWAGCLV
jgi:hypothetical protein